MKWLKTKIDDLRNVSAIPKAISRDAFRKNKRFMTGKLYCFFYDPIGKADLPYYDKFPMVLVLEKYADGFLGLNLHYLPYALRSGLINSLSLNNNKKDNTTRAINIMSASFFEPCIKHYLFGHVASKMMYINPDEWEKAILLPIEAFRKSNKTAVWAESKKKLGIR
jgi:hypothetical protein